MLAAITAIFAFQLIGEATVVALGLPLPGPVAGMMLFFAYLAWHGGVPETLGQVANGLLSNLSLLFVPAGVGVLQHLGRIQDDGMALVAALVPSTLFAIVVSGWVMARLKKGSDR